MLIFCASHVVEAPFATKLADAQPLSATGGREYSLFIATKEHIQQETPTGGHTTEYTGCSGLYIQPVQTGNPELHHDVRDHSTSS
jgi:hypothetical protein